jgi:DNA-binding IclR family transcriptional regulator
MNPNRLACLRSVIRQADQTVGEIANNVKLPPNQASMILRLLQSRGLIASHRKSRWTYYHAEADPLVEHAERVLAAFQAGYRTKPFSDRAVLSTLRAFTHPRRLTLLRLFETRTNVTAEWLMAHARLSQPALWRHARTLKESGLIDYSEKKQTWNLRPQKSLHPLARALLKAL